MTGDESEYNGFVHVVRGNVADQIDPEPRTEQGGTRRYLVMLSSGGDVELRRFYFREQEWLDKAILHLNEALEGKHDRPAYGQM